MAEYTATSGSYTTTLTVTEGAYDIASNTSPVTFTLTLKKNSGTGLWNNDSCPWSININGTSYSGSFTYDFRNYSSLTLKSSTTQTITHDSDGTKKIAVSASVNMDNTPYVYTMSPSGELTLATIPRASDIALSVSSFSITSSSGNAFSWSITAKSNSFYNRLRYSIGNKSNVSSNKGQGSSSGYFTNQELLSALPTSTSGSLTVYCDTYSDSGYSNLIGSKSVVITVSVNTSYIKPSVSLGNIGINSSPISGYAVAGHSKVQSAWSTSNSYGATSVTTYFTVSTGSLATTSSSSTSGTVVSNTIPSNTSNYTLTIYAYAKDSRGAVGTTVSKSITVYGYQPPTANLSAYRTTSSSSTNEDGAGTYAYVTFSGAVRSSVNSQNSIQSTVCTYSGSISGTATNGGHYALADTQSVTFKLTVTDKVTSSTASVTIATAQYPLDLYDDGNGNVGIGLGAIAKANAITTPLKIVSPSWQTRIMLCDVTDDEVKAQDSSLTTSSSDSDWFKALLKAICVKYPSTTTCRFIGRLSPNSQRSYDVTIYDTSVVSDGLPRYSYGYYVPYGTNDISIKPFGTSDYTYYWHDGITARYADGASSATSATNSTNVHVVNHNVSAGEHFYLGWVNNLSTEHQSIWVNDGLKYFTREGTTSQDGWAGLRLGNTTNVGTNGNKWGFVDFFPHTGAYVARLYATDTLTANRYFVLPNESGTLAIGDTVLWTGTIQGGATVSVNMSGYSKIRVYACTWGVQHIFEMDLTHTPNAGIVDSGYPFQAGSMIPMFASSNNSGTMEYHGCLCKVNTAKTVLWATTLGYSRWDSTNGVYVWTTRNSSAQYYVYRIDGII